MSAEPRDIVAVGGRLCIVCGHKKHATKAFAKLGYHAHDDICRDCRTEGPAVLYPVRAKIALRTLRVLAAGQTLAGRTLTRVEMMTLAAKTLNDLDDDGA